VNCIALTQPWQEGEDRRSRGPSALSLPRLSTLTDDKCLCRTSTGRSDENAACLGSPAATIGMIYIPPVFPVPTLDHVVVNARDRIDDAADTYRRPGLTLP